jgi:SepF-like predicted cell division protein (DUF552 family)
MASKGLLGKVFGGKTESEEDDYTEIDLGDMDQAVGSGPAETYVSGRGAFEPVTDPQLKREIYNGNIVVVDISPVKGDSLTRDRALKDLKQVASDVRGDIAMIKDDNLIVVTPMSIKIDRTKFTGK